MAWCRRWWTWTTTAHGGTSVTGSVTPPGGYLPEYQDPQLPQIANDLKETILRQRRPELYQVLAPKPPPK